MLLPETGISSTVLSAERQRAVAAAQAILAQGGWCMLEACIDIPHQVWEPRVLLFEQTADQVADAVADEVACEPGYDARLTGCNRRTLQPDPTMGSWLFHLADEPLSSLLAEPPHPERSW